jgi:hypothetical protein
MRKDVIVLVLLLVFSLLGNIYFLSEPSVTGNVVRGFDTYTSAVCEGNVCHDEVFVQCDGVNLSLGTIVGTKVEFEENWTDPRK